MIDALLRTQVVVGHLPGNLYRSTNRSNRRHLPKHPIQPFAKDGTYPINWYAVGPADLRLGERYYGRDVD
ncbi:hypothetical protein GGR93_000350 [Sulfitobacter noctilucicola]|uniref:Uncharacterized protein n=1 Tax=Sulfitobacter noctilucicola TaxID=1342301 RepID=A0A7W6M544_9RHOB|nr:hypothetical protein [Sulfitobacter noctilucicola]